MSGQDEAQRSQMVGEYRLIRKLGGGGFGTIHLAEHIHSHSQVAIKLLRVPLAKSGDFRDFINEARTMMLLRHPHIVPLLDFGLSREDLPFLVMEYIPAGKTVQDRHPKGSRVPLVTIVEYVEQIASALQYAHDHRIIHRDVKPGNMLLRADGTLLLSDFGIAKIVELHTIMSTQAQTGTPAYMAPEQHVGHPSFASDQYALAVVVYEWISGTRPFQGTALGLAVQHMTAMPPSLLNIVPTLPSSVEQVVFKALSKQPEQRFANVQEFAHALRAAVQQSTLSQVDTQKHPPDGPLSQAVLIQQPPALSPIAVPGTTSGVGKASRRLSPSSRYFFLLSSGLLVGILILALVIKMMGVNVQSTQALNNPVSVRPIATSAVLNANTVSSLVKKWSFPTQLSVFSSPAVAAGLVYVGSDDSNVYAVDALSGKQKWAFHTRNKVTSSPVVVAGVVYIGSGDGNVYAIDALSGKQKWVFPTADYVHSSPTVVAGVVYIGSVDRHVYAIDVQSGKQKWVFQTMGGWVRSSPAVVDGVVYVGSDDHSVYAIDALSGKQKWAFPTEDAVESSPTVADDIVYIGSDDKNVYAIDAQSGQPKWVFPTGNAVHSSPAVVDGVVYIGSDDHNVYAIGAQSGKQKWAFRAGNSVQSSPAVVNGIIYIGSMDRNVYALDAQSGQKKWAFQTGNSVLGVHSSPAVVDGVVYVGSQDHNLYAFGLPAMAS